MPSQTYLVVLDDLPQAQLDPDGFLNRTVLVADDDLNQAVWVQPQHLPARVDQHPFEQKVAVLSRTWELILSGSDQSVLTADRCLRIPGNVPHQAGVLGEEPIHALDYFASVREGYLPLAAANQLDRAPGVRSSIAHSHNNEGTDSK